MNITILNGNPNDSDAKFESYLKQLDELLAPKGHEITNLILRDMDIRYCIGCFGCWVKTPGNCSAADDDSKIVRTKAIHSDLLIFASPIIMGFTSALLKKTQDKLIPLVLPYVRLYYGEQHHVPRYDHYPRLGLLIQPEEDTDTEDINIINEIYRRDSLNFHTELAFSGITSTPVKEVADEINNL